MPCIHAHNISYQFENGQTLFDGLSFSINKNRTAIVGRNGVGKSTLVSMLTNTQKPTQGHVENHLDTLVFEQANNQALLGELSIAQFLGFADKINAIEQVEQGDCDPTLFDIIDEDWQAKQKLTELLDELSLPNSADILCSQLSGGQQTKLVLYRFFESNAELLVLDEPSNHLDKSARRWLDEKLSNYEGKVLLISHDIALLNKVDEIIELTSIGIKIYGGNYHYYNKQKALETNALLNAASAIKKQKRHIEKQTQLNQEKAQKRASKSSKLRKDGSQPKVLMDVKKDRASASASSAQKNSASRMRNLIEQQQEVAAKLEHTKPQTLTLAQNTTPKSTAIVLDELTLEYGRMTPISIKLLSTEKAHLLGGNGSGKSTLLKTIARLASPKMGQVTSSVACIYFDQQLNGFQMNADVLQNVKAFCPHIVESEARTLLANVGFRGESVYKMVGHLSGGERVKLAMLIASHQIEQPFLLLDEPDNHLDLESKQMFAQSLKAYNGGFVLVSHDPYFSDACGITHTLDMMEM
jgi:ATPase subunit of ABC transporter with duplicated ATPase domains